MNPKGITEGKKNQIASILLVWMISATFLIVFVPLHLPSAKGQVYHLNSADLEDKTGMPYDIGPVGDGEVIWNPNEDHIISSNYVIESWMTLNIPPMNYINDPAISHEINITGIWKIDVYGKLITNSNGNPFDKIAFLGAGINPFDGIYFYPDSEGRIFDTMVKYSINGVVFLPGSKLISPGVNRSEFDDNMISSLRFDGALGFTNVNMTNFDARGIPSTTSIQVVNGSLNISRVNFLSHGPDKPNLHISNADVLVSQGWFRSYSNPGPCVYVEGNSNGTVLSSCMFTLGNSIEDDNYYVRSNGSSILIDNCSFNTSKYGARSVIANENDFGIPAHIVIRQPTQSDTMVLWSNDGSFDNSTINATGGSSITLQWYMKVNVTDSDGFPIDNAPVWVEDRLGTPGLPASHITDASGWTGWFLSTELTKYESTEVNFNPFNVSALNNSVIGYADPEPSMNWSKEVYVVVPFNPVPNSPPIVSFIQTPIGIESGVISIDFMVDDTNVGDDGNLSINVEFFDPIAGIWKPATFGGDRDYLNINTLYTVAWTSNDIKDFPNNYSTNVKIRITPSDRAGLGIPDETGPFTVDNRLPIFLSDPVVTSTNTTALIQWTVDKDCAAAVLYGLDGTLTDETNGSTGSTIQSVYLTGLIPGRIYTFAIKSTDLLGNTNISLPITYTFETEIHIELFKEWNMISIAPIFTVFNLTTVLASITGEYNTVQWYDASDLKDHWKHYAPGKPFGNDLTEIYGEMGLWIHMKNDTVLIHDNIVPQTGWPPVQIQLLNGWNFVGYPSALARTVDDAMGSVNYNVVQTYDAYTDTWLSWDGSSGNLVNMELGRGYWIHVSSDQMWNIAYV
jgi:hypothetical protein